MTYICWLKNWWVALLLFKLLKQHCQLYGRLDYRISKVLLPRSGVSWLRTSLSLTVRPNETWNHLKDHSLQSEAEGGAKRVGVVGWWGSNRKHKRDTRLAGQQAVGFVPALMLNSKRLFLSECSSVWVSPVKNDRFFHRVTKQLLNLIPLEEKESRSR